MADQQPGKFPPRLLLDLNGACNLKCTMCMVHGKEVEVADARFNGVQARFRNMPTTLLEKMLDEIDASHETKPMIFTALNGEPLFGKSYREMVSMMKSRGFKVASHTNGILLDNSMAHFMVDSPLDVVSISLDAFKEETYKLIRENKHFQRIHKNITNLLKVRGEKPKPRIEVSMTILEENWEEEQAFVEYWTDYVDVIRINSVFSPEDNTVFPRKPVPTERKPCQSLFDSMPVFYNGDVGLCCRDPFCEDNMGNVGTSSLEEVWNGDKFASYRELHARGDWGLIPACKDCDGWAAYEYDETVTDRLLIRRSPIYTYYNVLDRLYTWNSDIRGTHSPKYDDLEQPASTGAND